MVSTKTAKSTNQILVTEKQLHEITAEITSQVTESLDLEGLRSSVKTNTDKVDTLQNTVDVFGKQLVDDRGEVVVIKEKIATLETRGKEIVKLLGNLGQQIIDGVKINIDKQEDRMVQKITDAVPSVVHMATTDVIEPKKGKLQRVADRGVWGKIWHKYFVRK